MNSLATWDYEESVNKVKPMVMNWKNLTVDIVQELYMARNELDNRGGSRYRGVSNVPSGTFEKGWREYLDEIGLAKSTVHRWLERYIPEEKKLLTPEELEERKQIETRKNQNESTAIHKRVMEAINNGTKPADWDDKTEKAYRRKLQEIAESKKRVEQYKSEMDAKNREREEREAEWKRQQQKMDEETDFLKMAGDAAIAHHQKRREFKERIKVSQSGESDFFIDALMDYLDTLENDNRRIEACQNIIKVCRGIATDLQVKDARGDN